MKCILDTHFLLWITIDAPRLSEFPWLERYAAWGVSPVSFLEVQYLAEVGRLEVDIDIVHEYGHERCPLHRR